jgi:DNA-binding winged helix-turn-helix (wHTH) protein
MGASASYPVYEFDEFELDVRQRRLTRRGSTQTLTITARAFDTLLYLVEHRDRLVEKSELLAAVWSGLVVEEGNLSTTIYTLRRLLGERPEEHR